MRALRRFVSSRTRGLFRCCCCFVIYSSSCDLGCLSKVADVDVDDEDVNVNGDLAFDSLTTFETADAIVTLAAAAAAAVAGELNSEDVNFGLLEAFRC